MNLRELHIKLEDLAELPSTHGATNCFYFQLNHPELGRLFIKKGEKVAQEIQNYKRVSEVMDPVHTLEPIGTIGVDAIALPYVENPDCGYRYVETLWEFPDSFDEFVTFQQKVFGALSSMYEHTRSSTGQNQQSLMFGSRVEARMAGLVELKDMIIPVPGGGKHTVADLIGEGLPILQDGKLVRLPSLRDMVSRLDLKLRAPHSYPSCLIHADTQPSNVVAHHGELKIIDLSDVRAGDDAAWDIGKWMNYVARFHNVVRSRGQFEGLPSLMPPQNPEVLEALRRDVVSQVSSVIGTDPQELCQRSVVAEFVVNLSTLRRHILKFPQVSSLVVQAIGETYVLAEKEI